MNEGSPLRQLAEYAGIDLSYYDIKGTRHEAPEGTLMGMLAAMGFDVSSERALRDALHEAREAPWRRGLAPVTVLRSTDDRPSLDLRVCATTNGRRFVWTIETETGDTLSGEFTPAELDLVDSHAGDGCVVERRRLTFPRPLVAGYHHLTVSGPAQSHAAQLIVAPQHCYIPVALAQEGRRLWALSAHLYSLRSAANWGIGDFTDLNRLMELSAAIGSAGVMVNPFHALYPGDPEKASPYAPSSRLFVNPLYLDTPRMLAPSNAVRGQILASAEVARRVAELRKRPLVDYAGVSQLKRRVFDLLFEEFQARVQAQGPDATSETSSFASFKQRGGSALDRFALFQALDERFGCSRPWRQWPEAYRRPAGQAVEGFAATNSARVEFHKFLQWQADRQLSVIARTACERALPVGLGRDLAVGVDADGADAWAEPAQFLGSLRIGAPPDEFNANGQEWGVLPPNPCAWHAVSYRPFIELLRANMRHAGAIRMDHAMGLQRLFCIPEGAKPSEGTYLRYPRDDLLGLVALESQRERCLIVAEDLGTVPEGFRDRMAESHMFGCRVLYFEKDWHGGGGFLPPESYPAPATVTVATHDLPTLAGYWQGGDIQARAVARPPGDPDSLGHDMAQRRKERELLFRALVRRGLLGSAREDTAVPDAMTAELMQAVHLYLASTQTRLLIVQLDDVLGEFDQLNLPGTTFEHANWRRKLSRELEELEADVTLNRLASALKKVGRS